MLEVLELMSYMSPTAHMSDQEWLDKLEPVTDLVSDDRVTDNEETYGALYLHYSCDETIV